MRDGQHMRLSGCRLGGSLNARHVSPPWLPLNGQPFFGTGMHSRGRKA